MLGKLMSSRRKFVGALCISIISKMVVDVEGGGGSREESTYDLQHLLLLRFFVFVFVFFFFSFIFILLITARKRVAEPIAHFPVEGFAVHASSAAGG